MSKINQYFSQIRVIAWLFVFLLSGIESIAQVTCKSNIVLHLADDGTRVLKIMDFTSDDCVGCTIDVTGDEYTDTIDCGVSGKVISVAIMQPGQSTVICNARILDTTAPIFTGCADIMVGCHLDVMSDPIDSFGIVATDACGIDTIFPIICGGEAGDCVTSTKVLKIQWQAIDSSGNVSSCTQMLTYEKESLSEVTLPDRDTSYCDDAFIEPIPPMIRDSISIESLCGLLVGEYDDDTLSLCGAELQIRRTWSVLDVCSLESQDFEQIVVVLDSVGPIISCPTDDSIFVDPTSCEALYLFPELDISFNCLPADTLSHVIYTYRGASYLPGDAVSLSHGTDTVMIIAADNCWQLDTCQYILKVLDTFPPVTVACLGDTILIADPNLDNIMMCDELDSRFGGPPMFFDACCSSEVNCLLINAIDALQDTGFILRKYWAQDTCGNVSDTCTQLIHSVPVVRTIGHRQSQSSNSNGKRNLFDKNRSNIGSLDVGSIVSENQLSVWPNPFTDRIELDYYSPTDAQSTIRIYDGRGRLVLTKDYHPAEGFNRKIIEFKEEDAINPGLYYLSIMYGGQNQPEVIKLMRLGD